MASGDTEVIALRRGDDVIGWIDYGAEVPLPGSEITIPLTDISYAGTHSLRDLNGPGLSLEFQDDQGKSLGTLNGTPAITNAQTVTIKVW
jgi:hypothetical protein